MSAGSLPANERLAVENALSWCHASECQLLLADYIAQHGGAATVPEMMVDSELALYLQGSFLKDIALTGGEPAFMRALDKADHFFGQRGEQYFLRADLGPPPADLIEITKQLALGRIETGALEPYSEISVLAMDSIANRGGAAALAEIAADVAPYFSGAFLGSGRVFYTGALMACHLDSNKHFQRADGKYALAGATITASASEVRATQALCKLRQALRERLPAPSPLYSLLLECVRLRGGAVERDVAPLLPGLTTAAGKRFTLSVAQLMSAAPFYFQRLPKKRGGGDEALCTAPDLNLDEVRAAATERIRSAGGTVPKHIAEPDRGADASREGRKRQLSEALQEQARAEDSEAEAEAEAEAAEARAGERKENGHNVDRELIASFTAEQTARLDTLIRAHMAGRAGTTDTRPVADALFPYYAGIAGTCARRWTVRLHLRKRLKRLSRERTRWVIPASEAPPADEVRRVKEEAEERKVELGA